MSTSITVEIHRGTIDPQGLGSDEDAEAIKEHVLSTLAEAFPGAEIRAVGPGGRTGGVSDSGYDISGEVRQIVKLAVNDWCSQA